MPTYEYVCKKCGHQLEELQPFSEPPLVHCPNCNTDNLARVMGTGSGLIFKGSGFYLTDYKKRGKEKPKGTPASEEKKVEQKKEKKGDSASPSSSPKGSSKSQDSSDKE